MTDRVWTEEEVTEAKRNYTPIRPAKVELGGDYYYRCHWIMCNADLKKYWDYCPNCGQRIDWDD